ncbi:hypothetical protein F5Y04DRAFT_288018 [Hypomontagnella monticulosa]|nr:hypothetical protein F5Y04DRAFT_288018 [Hypomontagnella monticulosa]
MSDINPATSPSRPLGIDVPWFDFELHYGLSSRSVKEVLDEILEDLTTYTPIHNWDNKLTIKPLDKLAGEVRSYISKQDFNFNTLLRFTRVEEVWAWDGTNHVRPAIQQAVDVGSHLFFSKQVKRPSGTDNPSPPNPPKDITPSHPSEVNAPSEDSNPSNHSQGRIVYITERDSHLNRAILLLLYPFCNRLQYEDCGYISSFIERHLDLRCFLRKPYHWQQASGPELDSSRQKCYKRVTISCHIAYLKLDINAPDNDKEIVDRIYLSPVVWGPAINDSELPSLLKASSSILFTLVVPEESESHQEEISLLRNPQALWTVLVVNSLQKFAVDYRREEHVTPVAQFLRGITSSLCTQRMNARHIHDFLGEQLKSSDNNSLFDDENFTKSTLYHSSIQACDELETSISSSLRFMRGIRAGYLAKLCHEANSSERLGIDHWLQKMEEETLELEDMQARVHALSSQVREMRNALNGVTSVLEARVAVQQGNRMKTLGYLATLYLPLTATSALYSMSVLPTSASFASFFIVLAIFILLTIIGLNLSALLALFATVTPRSRKKTPGPIEGNLMSKLPPWMENYIRFYMNVFDNSNELSLKDSFNLPVTGREWLTLPIYLAVYVTRILPALAMRRWLLPEILYPRYKWLLFLYRHNRYVTIKYHPILFVTDFIRFTLIPAWVVLALCIVCYFPILDMLIGILILIPSTLIKAFS